MSVHLADEKLFGLKKLSSLIPTGGVYLQRYFTALNLLDEEKRVNLDIGCFEGGLSNFLTECKRKVIAIDIKMSKNPKFPFVLADARNLPFKRSSFDQIFCLDVLEHIKDDYTVAKEISRVLKINGALVITTPSKHWKYPYYNFMKFISPNEKQLMKSFGHVRRGYDVSDIENLFKNFRIEKVQYFINKFAALFFDLEYSNLLILKNMILKFFGLFVYLNFKLSTKKWGTHIGVRLVKTK